MNFHTTLLGIIFLYSCNQTLNEADALKQSETIIVDTTLTSVTTTASIDTKNTPPNDVIDFAKTLIGTPYLYGSADPARGFDCSGFITYVFNHFNIKVPRSSIDFTNLETEVSLQRTQPGDLILFSGTDSTNRNVGHMGIVTSIQDSICFIHSTSGKAMGVTITPLNQHYMKRFVKVVRIFNAN